MSDEKTLTRRTLFPIRKIMSNALEELGATLGMLDHYERSVTFVATHFGVQPKDMFIVGEFEVHEDEETEKVHETLVRTFPGFYDPSPNKDEYRKLISFKEALQRDWEPAR